jgi:hypothetical protein
MFGRIGEVLIYLVVLGLVLVQSLATPWFSPHGYGGALCCQAERKRSMATIMPEIHISGLYFLVAIFPLIWSIPECLAYLANGIVKPHNSPSLWSLLPVILNQPQDR